MSVLVNVTVLFQPFLTLCLLAKTLSQPSRLKGPASSPVDECTKRMKSSWAGPWLHPNTSTSAHSVLISSRDDVPLS